MLTENVTVYRFSGAGPLAGLFAPDCAAAAAGCVPPGAAGFAAAAAGGAGTLPNANERLIPRLTEKKLGPMPKFRGINASPGAGARSKSPKRVCLRFFASVCAVANAGRSVNKPSPFVSRPVTILKGLPVENTMNGFRFTFNFGRIIVPPTKKLPLGMNDTREYSLVKS